MPERQENLIYEDVPFERRWMRFERCMWLVLTLMLLGACLGAFGKGVYARHTERAGALSVEYDRFLRSRTQTDMVISLDRSATRTGEVRLLVTGALLEKTRIHDVVPKPSTQELLEKGVALTFKTVPDMPGTVTIIQKVEGIGRVQSHIALDHGSPVPVNQVILP